ncbi:MAG: DNA polymerase ligase N-terminal domain-containing protein, partial [Bdellovibrionota bacterium]
MSLAVYRKKRDFKRTREPEGKKAKDLRRHSFVIQKHDASHLHYDFRLEMDGVLKSWAVPKGPSLNPGDKRLAVQVEDHPVSYANFEGEIPADEYGGGHVIVWDRGVWSSDKDPHAQIKKGRLEFELKGEKLSGHWLLVRTARSSSKKPNWLLIKRHDSAATDKIDVTDLDKSVISDVTIEELKEGADLKKAKKLKIKNEPTPQDLLKNVKRAIPHEIRPQLADLADKAPRGDRWIHEVKY